MSCPIVWAAPEAMEPMMKMTMAAWKTCLRP